MISYAVNLFSNYNIMSKTKVTFFCQNCGAPSAKWIGKCPSCNEWNTYVEEVVHKESKNDRLQLFSGNKSTKTSNKSILLQDVGLQDFPRIAVPGKELTRVLGGGIVPGSLVLLGGEPGIGKSTLMLQLALRLKNLKVLYVSGEESEQQIKMRAERIGVTTDNCFILQETNTQNIFQQIERGSFQYILPSILALQHSSLEAVTDNNSEKKLNLANIDESASKYEVNEIMVIEE